MSRHPVLLSTVEAGAGPATRRRLLAILLDRLLAVKRPLAHTQRMTERTPTIDWRALADRVLDGETIDRETALTLLRASDADTAEVVAAAHRIRRTYFGNTVKVNFLVNIKSGICPEDCHYCSQSKLSRAPIDKYPLLAGSDIASAARRGHEFGARRSVTGAAWRRIQSGAMR